MGRRQSLETSQQTHPKTPEQQGGAYADKTPAPMKTAAGSLAVREKMASACRFFTEYAMYSMTSVLEYRIKFLDTLLFAPVIWTAAQGWRPV